MSKYDDVTARVGLSESPRRQISRQMLVRSISDAGNVTLRPFSDWSHRS